MPRQTQKRAIEDFMLCGFALSFLALAFGFSVIYEFIYGMVFYSVRCWLHGGARVG